MTRATRIYLLSTVCIALAVLFTLFSNLLFHEILGTVDTSAFTINPLTSTTEKRLKDIKDDVKITAIIDPENTKFNQVTNLLRAFEYASMVQVSNKISVQIINPRANFNRTGFYTHRGATGEGLFFENHLRSIFVPLDRLYYTPSSAITPQSLTLRPIEYHGNFIGEAICSTTLARLSRHADVATIYYLTNHGQPPLEPSTHKAPHTLNLHTFARELTNEGFTLKPLDLKGGKVKIPSDSLALLNIAPQSTFTTEESLIIADYLNAGGRFFFALDPVGTVGLDTLLEQWGLAVGTTIVESVPPLAQRISVAKLVTGNPIIPTPSDNMPLYLGAPHQLFTAPTTSTQTQQISPLLSLNNDTPTQTYVAMSSQHGKQATADLAIKSGRMILLGDSYCLSDTLLNDRASANRTFLINAIQWLTALPLADASPNQQMILFHLSDTQWQILLATSSLLFPILVAALMTLLFKKHR